jgi:hypothetical protein
VAVLEGQAPLPQGAVHHDGELVPRERLGQIVEYAFLRQVRVFGLEQGQRPLGVEGGQATMSGPAQDARLGDAARIP